MTMFPDDITLLAENIIRLYTGQNLKIVTAESCTGGLVAGALTAIPGSSGVVERGFITYSNEAKREVLGVDELALKQFGAVSPEVAAQMARGAVEFSQADVAVSITGIAGPDGGTADKPVGLVYFGLASRQGTVMHYKCNFSGDRNAIRLRAVFEALKLLEMLTETNSDEEELNID